MKKLLTFLLVMMCLQTMAQKPIIVKPTQIPPGQNPGKIIKQGEMVKKAMEEKAAIDKVLNAELVKVDLVIKNDGGWSASFFQIRSFYLRDDIKNPPFLFAGLDQMERVTTSSPDYKNTYTIVQKPGFLGKETYQQLLTNGMTVAIDFRNRKSKPGERFGGEYSADFTVILYFSDGTRLEYPLQTLNISNRGTWKSNTDLKIVKRIEGSEIPDPAKPGVGGVK